MKEPPDRLALRELLQVSRPKAIHRVCHYLYFPAEADAVGAADSLRHLGLEVTTRLGADGINWLVLVTQHVVPTDETIGAIRAICDEAAAANSGEYDGWEAATVK